MTEQQAIRAVLERSNKRRVVEDARPWWKRLVGSLHVVIKPGKSFAKPVKGIGVSGGVEF